jgi:hypothetical protein
MLLEKDFPTLDWGTNHAYLCHKRSDFGLIAKSEFNRLRDICLSGNMRLLTSTGKSFRIIDMVPVVVTNPILRLFSNFRVQNVLDDGQCIDLIEFKRRVEWAVRERQKGDYDCDLLGKLRPKLAEAQTYREAIAAVPTNM